LVSAFGTLYCGMFFAAGLQRTEASLLDRDDRLVDTLPLLLWICLRERSDVVVLPQIQCASLPKPWMYEKLRKFV
jgi:hypothetical protein